MLTLKQPTMLGNIPDDWQNPPLTDLLIDHFPGDWGDESGPFMKAVLRSTNLTETLHLDTTDVAQRSVKPKSNKNLEPRTGDILLERSGGGPDQPVGRAAYIQQEMAGYGFSNFLHLLRPNPEKVDPRLLAWILHRIQATKRVVRLEQQTTQMRNLNFRDYLTMPLPLPPTVDEQAAIARVLDAVDTAIGRTGTAVNESENVRVALEQQLFARGLDKNGELRRPNEEHPTDYLQSKLGLYPKDWCVTRLGRCCRRITDGTHQAVTVAANGVPFLYVSCVRRGKILWERAERVTQKDYDVISRGRVPAPGVVLYTAVGSYGLAAEVDVKHAFSFQRHIAIIYPNQSCLSGAYLAAWFNSEKGRVWSDILAVGNAQKTVTLTELGKFPIALPESDEQAEIVRVLGKASDVTKKLEVKLAAFVELKKSLMQDLLTGHRRVQANQVDSEDGGRAL